MDDFRPNIQNSPIKKASDFVSKKERKNKRRLFLLKAKRRLFKHVWLTRFLILFFATGVFFAISIGVFSIIKRTRFGSQLGGVYSFVSAPVSRVNSFEGRTNIVILGKGGIGHDAPDLTDTIIYTSISYNKPSIDLISIPRDIWVPEIRAKINSAYYWGNQKQVGGGLILAKSTTEEIVGKPIHYSIVIDFSGFREIVDILGGIEVDVQTGFVDERYPIEGKQNDECDGDLQYNCRYETVEFKKGSQLMNTETALKFARSRNAQGDEGTDIARAKRQELVIEAMKKKLLSKEVLFNPGKIRSLIEVFNESFETDVQTTQLAILARKLWQARDNFETHVLPESLLVNPPISALYDNLYVFIPKENEWDEIHDWVSEIIDK